MWSCHGERSPDGGATRKGNGSSFKGHSPWGGVETATNGGVVTKWEKTRTSHNQILTIGAVEKPQLAHKIQFDSKRDGKREMLQLSVDSLHAIANSLALQNCCLGLIDDGAPNGSRRHDAMCERDHFGGPQETRGDKCHDPSFSMRPSLVGRPHRMTVWKQLGNLQGLGRPSAK